MIPNKRAIYCLLGMLPLAIAASYSKPVLWLLALVCAVFAILFLVEYLLLRQQSRLLSVNRNCAKSWSLGVPTRVSLELHNASSRRCTVQCYDLHPAEFITEGLPQSISLNAGQRGTLSYRITPTSRGDFQQSGVACRLSLWLWQYQSTLQAQTDFRVYPNFAAQRQFNKLAAASIQTQLGTEKLRLRGGGSDFHQLREFRDGDSLRAIDWKATSRLKKVISREYQDERDQQIVILLDCGKRMAHADGNLSHLDETLNSVMLLSHIAAKQGDAVGLMTFGGVDRWIPPRKGAAASQQLLQQLYDLTPTRESPDFVTAANALMQRMRKRALVIIVTNTRNEEQQSLAESITLLRKRHLVLVADLKETIVSDILKKRITDPDSAYSWLGACDYQTQRDHFHNRLKGYGALILDTEPEMLTGQLISRYQQIKNLGSL